MSAAWMVPGLSGISNRGKWAAIASPDSDSCPAMGRTSVVSDKHTLFPSSSTDLAGKIKCKTALPIEVGLAVTPNCPLIGFIGRLDYQQGTDLIQSARQELLQDAVHFIMLRSGDSDAEPLMRVSYRITAGCEILLMPSHFEPCGLNQLFALHGYVNEVFDTFPQLCIIGQVSEIGPLIGRVAFVGFEVVVDVLDQPGSGIVSGLASRGNMISLLSFEMANTIAKGSKMLKSFSAKNLQSLPKEILHSASAEGRKPSIWDTFSHAGKGIDKRTADIALGAEYGGYLSPKLIADFTAYADVYFTKFGDRVQTWVTFNEHILSFNDSVPSWNMLLSLWFALLRRALINRSICVSSYILLAHAAAVHLYSEQYQDTQSNYVGLILLARWFDPLTASLQDVNASPRMLAFHLGWILDPLYYGDYPSTMKEIVGSRLPLFGVDELELMRGSFDFLGLTHYVVLFVKGSSAVKDQSETDFYRNITIE